MDKQQLLETITNLNQVDKISLEELQHLASSYPYFQTAHLLLAYKTQKIMHAEHSSVLSRAATVVQNREILFRLLHPTLLNSNTISDLENKPFEPPILDEHEDATIAISPVIIPTTPNFIPDEELPLTALHLHASASTEQTAEQLEQEIEVLVQKFGANPPATITLNDDEPEVKSNDLMVQTENNNQSSNTTEPTPIIPELNNDSSLEFINTINDDDVDENLNIADIAKQALTELQAVLSNNINHRNIEEVSTDTEEAEENTDFVALHTEAISKEALAELQVELSNNKTEEEEEQVQLANEVNPPDIEEENTDSVALHTEAISKEALAELQVELSNNKTEEEEEEQVQLANEVNPPDIEEENTDSVALHTEAISKEALAELQVELSNNQTEEEEEQVQSANEVNPPDIEEENTDSVALHTEAISKEALAELQVELSNNQTEEEEEEEQVQLANEVNPPDIEEENTDSVALHTEAISKEALAELQAYLLNTTENESANLPVEPVPNNEAIEAAAQKSLEEDPDLLLALQQKIANYKQVLHMQANPVKTDEPNSIENEENMEEADLSPTGIVTERLAKVYARQGYYDEAIKIYKQLNLKFPEKRRYFAVRIEELRNKLV